jgi:hypothetical protein
MFMSSVPTRNLIAFSQDVGTSATPRYLIQANGRFYTSQPAASDPAYQAYYPIEEGHARLAGAPSAPAASSAALGSPGCRAKRGCPAGAPCLCSCIPA